VFRFLFLFLICLGFQKQDKWIYSGSEDKTIRIWDLKSLSCKKKYQVKSSVNTLCLYKNQAELISGEEDGRISIYDLTKDECIFEKYPHGSTGIRSISTVGDYVVSGNNAGQVDIWEKKETSLQLIVSFQAHQQYILKCLISPNAQQVRERIEN
jgi:target of rapamycin complex subunit LST8